MRTRREAAAYSLCAPYRAVHGAMGFRCACLCVVLSCAAALKCRGLSIVAIPPWPGTDTPPVSRNFWQPMWQPRHEIWEIGYPSTGVKVRQRRAGN